jgi:hypothetical protein
VDEVVLCTDYQGAFMRDSRRNGMILPVFIFGLLLVFLAPSPEARAQFFTQDLTMHSTTNSSGMMGRGGGTTTETDYYSKNAMKTSSSDGNDSIIRFDTEKVISIDNKRKTYTEITFKQLQEMLDKMAGEMKMEPGAMEAMKKMMGQTATSFTVTKVGPGEEIAGYPTDKYLIKGPMDMEIWAAASLKIPAEYYDVLRLRTPANPMFDMGKMFEEMKKISGIPMKTVTTIRMMGNEMKTTKVVTSVEKGSIPASVFEVPAGYKLVEAKLH